MSENSSSYVFNISVSKFVSITASVHKGFVLTSCTGSERFKLADMTYAQMSDYYFTSCTLGNRNKFNVTIQIKDTPSLTCSQD